MVPLFYTANIFCMSNISAITYKTADGRFGDSLLNYSKAKWLSYKNNLDFYWLPFEYSDSLRICELEKIYISGMEKKYKKVVRFYEDNEFKLGLQDAVKIDMQSSCFYISNYYANIIVDWEDKKFTSELKKTIAPIFEIKKQKLPGDRVSVAVHVRKGGGLDEPLVLDSEANKRSPRWGYFADERFPLKFPPDSYYIEQIKKLYQILNKAPLYVYIFTDDHDPLRIVSKYEKLLVGLDIKFDCRRSRNSHDSNVVEDFFTMTQFDCFIRNGSNFSFMVDVIGDFFIVISLEKACWEGNSWVASDIKVKINNDKMPILIKNRV